MSPSTYAAGSPAYRVLPSASNPRIGLPFVLFMIVVGVVAILFTVFVDSEILLILKPHCSF